jgi:putative glutamate/gamma-aminobutyrate antiporter
MVQKRILGVFTLAMINVAAIVSLRNLSIMVEYGFSAIFFTAAAALIFFIPTALVCAELATGWPHAGGVYRWVSEAFGRKVGFFAMWVAWMLSIAWFPTILTFTAATIAYIYDPTLIHNKFFMLTTMLVILWISTFINFFGLKASGFISSVGVILGTIIPGAFIIILGMYWWGAGFPLKVDLTFEAFVPDLHFSKLVFFAGLILGFAGMEMSAFHAGEAKNPQRDYPKAILISAVVILLISILGALSIAFVVPKQDVSLFAGILQAFEVFFKEFNMQWIVPILAFLTFVGTLAGINTWIIGPAKGILTCAEDGFLPPFLQTINKNGAPVGTLIFQAIAASLLALNNLFMPDTNSAFWLISALTIQFAMVMYILIFAAGIYLRYKQPNQTRGYKIGGFGNFGMWLVSGIGIAASIFSFVVVYLPPEQLTTGSLLYYNSYLIGGFLALCFPPFLFMAISKPSWNHAYSSKA